MFRKGFNLTISSRRILRPYQFYFIKRKARRLTDSRYEIGVPLVNGRYTKRTTFSAKNGILKGNSLDKAFTYGTLLNPDYTSFASTIMKGVLRVF